MLKPFMLRRIKADVEKSVPPKVEKKVMCPMSPQQTFWYKRILMKDSALLQTLEGKGNAIQCYKLIIAITTYTYTYIHIHIPFLM